MSDEPTRRRRARPKAHLGRSLGGVVGYATRRVPIKGVGRLTDRLYCARCGQKRTVCECAPNA